MGIHMCILCTYCVLKQRRTYSNFSGNADLAIQAVYKELALTPEEKKARRERTERNTRQTSKTMSHKMNLQEKLIAIADHYGLENQTIKLAEEGAELSAAMLKNLGIAFRKAKGENSVKLRQQEAEAKEKMTEETADVLLVSRQLEYLMISDPEFEKEITKIMNDKADRQLERIADEKHGFSENKG